MGAAKTKKARILAAMGNREIAILPDKKIADMFGISERTVRNYRQCSGTELKFVRGGNKIVEPEVVIDKGRDMTAGEFKKMEDGVVAATVVAATVKGSEDWANELLDFLYEHKEEDLENGQQKKLDSIKRSFVAACKREDRDPQMVLRIVQI